MKNLRNRSRSLAQQVQASAQAALAPSLNIAATAPPPPIPQAVLDWLAQLRLLYGVPFEYLVPDYRMLPPESIRFFYLDSNWTDRMVEGALSIGPGSTQDVLSAYALAQQLKPSLDQAMALTRSKLREVQAPASVTVGGTITGLLLRSIAVSGWPGLEVRASLADGTPLEMVRMDTLSPEVLLVLFEGKGVPTEVQVNEPSEGLHFGVRRLGSPAVPSTLLRGLGFGGYAAGVELTRGDPPTTIPVTVPMRTNPTYSGVVDVTALAGALKGALGGLTPSGLDPAGDFTSCELAIQMVRGAGLQVFGGPGSKP